MQSIATLTMNPTIDLSYQVDHMQHTHKMRAANERYAPGGGGINVARVFSRLGGNARCVYLSGGATGVALDGLIDLHQLTRARIPIQEPTRVAAAVLERDTGKEYRFTPAGPQVSEAEWRACLDALSDIRCDMLVASGSLPPGVPPDFYAHVAAIMDKRGIETVLDTSGEALRQGLRASRFLLIKPSLGELQILLGRELRGAEQVAESAQAIVSAGQARLVAVTMGHDGAVLASDSGTTFLPAIPVEAKSAVGAGDSFLAAMVHAMARGWEPLDAFRYGVAAGSAAVLTPGTDLAQPADIERLFSSFRLP